MSDKEFKLRFPEDWEEFKNKLDLLPDDNEIRQEYLESFLLFLAYNRLSGLRKVIRFYN